MGGKPGGELNETEARAMALRYLARRDYSVFELSRKLAGRGVSRHLARQVSENLAEAGLVSDERFAEVFCRHRFNQHYGPQRIRAELRSKGVDDPIIASCMAPYEDQWHASARTWVGKRVAGELDQKQKARIYRGGMNRGFSHDQVMRAIEWVQKNA